MTIELLRKRVSREVAEIDGEWGIGHDLMGIVHEAYLVLVEQAVLRLDNQGGRADGKRMCLECGCRVLRTGGSLLWLALNHRGFCPSLFPINVANDWDLSSCGLHLLPDEPKLLHIPVVEVLTIMEQDRFDMTKKLMWQSGLLK